jgi:hypothetical protein
MNTRRNFLAGLGFGLGALALPSAARAGGRRRRYCPPADCTPVATPLCIESAIRVCSTACIVFNAGQDSNGYYHYSCKCDVAGCSPAFGLLSKTFYAATGCGAGTNCGAGVPVGGALKAVIMKCSGSSADLQMFPDASPTEPSHLWTQGIQRGHDVGESIDTFFKRTSTDVTAMYVARIKFISGHDKRTPVHAQLYKIRNDRLNYTLYYGQELRAGQSSGDPTSNPPIGALMDEKYPKHQQIIFDGITYNIALRAT